MDLLTWPWLAGLGLAPGLGWFDPAAHEIGRQVLQRGVAAVFLIAFVSTWRQFPALLGEHGLLPVPEHLARLRAIEARADATRGGTGRARRRLVGRPSLFRLRRLAYTDRRLRAMTVIGAVLAASVVVGLPQRGPAWLVAAVFLVMWALYLSIVDIGQTFYGFGWEMLLLEAGFLSAWTGPADELMPQPLLVLVAWLLFRLEFGAGMIKWRGGSEWRDLTAMEHHHETQPMPGPLSRQAHLLPRWFHHCEVVANFVAQLVFPWLLFVPEPLASIASFVVIVTQLWLVLTGNYAWLNWLTIVLAASLVSDPVWRWMLGLPAQETVGPAPSPVSWQLIVWAVVVLLVVRSREPLRNLFRRSQLMNAAFDRWQLVNAYGAFGTVTSRRVEMEIEGLAPADTDGAAADAADGLEPGGAARPSADAERWLPYRFHGKPGDLKRIPRQWAPYHLRLDWLMWFLPFGPVTAQSWFLRLLVRLLEADPATLRLLRVDPFDGRRPRAIRARSYEYRFTTRAERRRTGCRWSRRLLDEPVPPVRLDAVGTDR